MNFFFNNLKENNNNQNANNIQEIKKEDTNLRNKKKKRHIHKNSNILYNNNQFSNNQPMNINQINNNDNVQNNSNYNNFNHSFSQQIPNFYNQYNNQANNQANILSEKEEEEEEDEKEENEIKEDEDKKKCSLNEHNEIDAIIYCQECKVYMCKKCEKVHSGLLKNHHFYSLDKNINEIFTGLCTKPNHSMSLEYFCKTHNQLCCAACISKIRNKGNGEHKNCKVYDISKIKNKKKNILEQNIINLEELSNKLEPSIKELKTIFVKINEAKDNLKAKVQKNF